MRSSTSSQLQLALMSMPPILAILKTPLRVPMVLFFSGLVGHFSGVAGVAGSVGELVFGVAEEILLGSGEVLGGHLLLHVGEHGIDHLFGGGPVHGGRIVNGPGKLTEHRVYLRWGIGYKITQG